VKKLVVCPCGETIRADNDDELVSKVQEHASKIHDGMKIERAQVMEMAQPDPS
jgi:predicted small metal-binding protein